MKTLKASLAVLVLASLCLAQGTQRSASAGAADKAWASFYASFKSAVTKHDKTALRPLLSKKISVEDGSITSKDLLDGLSSASEWQPYEAFLKSPATGKGTKRLIKDKNGSTLMFSFLAGKWVLTEHQMGG